MDSKEGWLISSGHFNVAPAAQQQLGFFSYQSGKGPFNFSISDTVKIPKGNSFEYTIYFKVSSADTNADIGGFETHLSDEEYQKARNSLISLGKVNSGDPEVIEEVAMEYCLNKLGFLDKADAPTNEMPDDAFEGEDMTTPDEDLPLPDEEAKVAAKRLKAAARLLEAIRDTGIHVDPKLLPRTAMVSDSLKSLDHFIRGTR